jgi:regulator of RNase E activity RraA
MDSAIRPIWTSPRIVGAAVTVWCHSGDNLMLHKAISLARPNDILVVNTQGNLNNAVFGELLASSAVKMGVRGAIVDGAVRDAEAIEALGLPVYARGLAPGACNKDGGGEIGLPVACGGVAVRAGDVIIADRDGVTVVPLDDAPAVAKLTAGQIEREEKRLQEIASGLVMRAEIDEILRLAKVID